ADALPSHIVPAKVYSKARVPAKCELVRVGYGGRNGVNRLFYSSPLFLQQSDDIRTIISQDSTAVLGDSGGGLFFKGSLDEEMQLLAIHSTFEAPNVVFSVFVPQYMEWISVWKQVWKYQKESLHTAVDETL
ncbi:MAG: hypothetical protein KDC47_10415, partial [Flavobacteriaceae bacterium]|nr:hypothetical protein [Flavobacteriaceae bacterium]